MDLEFVPYPKIGRLKRQCTVTEKIDGTNAQIVFDHDGNILCGSRKRQIWPNGTEGHDKACDNFGFAGWAYGCREELFEYLGPGRHYGEWAGAGIQNGYDGMEKGFYLFNTFREDSSDHIPGLYKVPVLYQGDFASDLVDAIMNELLAHGSFINPGSAPEGIVIYHHGTRSLAKCTYEYDGTGKPE